MAIHSINELITRLKSLSFPSRYYIPSLPVFSITLRTKDNQECYFYYNWYGDSYGGILQSASIPPEKLIILPEDIFALAGECKPSVFEAIKRMSDQYIMEDFPLYNEFKRECLLVPDESSRCDTAFVTFNDMTNDYEIHYNREFLLRSAIKDAVIWAGMDSHPNYRMYLTKSVAFVFLHEMLHVLSNHMKNKALQESMPPMTINILGDSYINTLLRVFMDIPVIYGFVDESVRFSGVSIRDLNINTVEDILSKWIAKTKEGNLGKPGYFASRIDASKGTPMSVEVTVSRQGHEILFGNISNDYMLEVEQLISEFIKTEEVSSGVEGLGGIRAKVSQGSSEGDTDVSREDQQVVPLEEVLAIDQERQEDIQQEK